ncbi:MAG: DUF58 domain-containing protein [Acidimicrobiia bacterium]|nr:DUF58 domain-containing protein [Acidimicrobiia bacterium]
MPTPRGWACFFLGVLAVVAGRVLGLVELYVVGAILLSLSILAVVVAVMRPIRVGVGRTVAPARLHVGSVGRVELAVRNGSTKAPVMQLTDNVEGTAGAQLFVSPLKPDEVTRAAYKLPTERRGIVRVGPVDFVAHDPFGLAVRRFTAPSVGQLVVYPEVVALPAAPPSPATERRSMSDTPEFLGGRSEEFHALRPYVPGDDIRRINWASSARHDDLIVREDEAPTQNHLTVLLDNAALNTGPAVDKAASVAASLVSSMRNRSDPFRLLTVDGQDTGFVLGTAGVEQALSILAIVDHVSPTQTSAVPLDAQGAVVVVTTASPTVARSALVSFGRIMFITLEPSAWDSSLPPVGSSTEAAGREIHIRLGSLGDLASVWSRSITTLMSTSGQR